MKKIIALLATVLPLSLVAQSGSKPSELDSPTAIILLIIICGLALAITLLGNVVIGAARLYFERYKQVKERTKNEGAKILSVILLLLVSGTSFAQDKPDAVTVAGPMAEGMSNTTFLIMVIIIFLELIVIATLALFLKKFVKLDFDAEVSAAEATVVAYKEPLWKRLWDKANNFRSLKEEADIDLGHDYDGIRELDNRLPPWWIYGFFITILFSGVYLWRYQVAHSAPGSVEEYNIAVQEAAIQQEAYLATAANNIDEKTVKVLTESSDIDAGKKVYEAACAPCHKADGGGLVGPNLTDDYWLHGGSIQEVFISIKYGWPEKGMKSWKDDYSPKQIAQLASYIKALHGTNPPEAKEKQGELYKEESPAPAGAPADSAAQKNDPKVVKQ